MSGMYNKDMFTRQFDQNFEGESSIALYRPECQLALQAS